MHSRPHAGPQIYYAEQKPAVFLRKLESSRRSSAIKSVSSEGGEGVEAVALMYTHYFTMCKIESEWDLLSSTGSSARCSVMS